jgi:hypothetical protein
MGLVEVDLVYDSVGAEIVRSWLAAEGIDAVLFDAGVASLFGGGMQGVRVMVPAADEARARALLATFEAS